MLSLFRRPLWSGRPEFEDSHFGTQRDTLSPVYILYRHCTFFFVRSQTISFFGLEAIQSDMNVSTQINGSKVSEDAVPLQSESEHVFGISTQTSIIMQITILAGKGGKGGKCITQPLPLDEHCFNDRELRIVTKNAKGRNNETTSWSNKGLLQLCQLKFSSLAFGWLQQCPSNATAKQMFTERPWTQGFPWLELDLHRKTRHGEISRCAER